MTHQPAGPPTLLFPKQVCLCQRLFWEWRFLLSPRASLLFYFKDVFSKGSSGHSIACCRHAIHFVLIQYLKWSHGPYHSVPNSQNLKIGGRTYRWKKISVTLLRGCVVVFMFSPLLAAQHPQFPLSLMLLNGSVYWTFDHIQFLLCSRSPLLFNQDMWLDSPATTVRLSGVKKIERTMMFKRWLAVSFDKQRMQRSYAYLVPEKILHNNSTFSRPQWIRMLNMALHNSSNSIGEIDFEVGLGLLMKNNS